TRLGEIVGPPERDDADLGDPAALQHAVDRLVDAAVAAGDEELLRAPGDGLLHLLLEVPGALAFQHLVRGVVVGQQGAERGAEAAGATAARRRVHARGNRHRRVRHPGCGPGATMVADMYKASGCWMLALGVKFLLSYCGGSFLGSMIVGRLRGGVDIG